MSKLPNDVFSKAVRDYYDLKNSLDEFLELKKKAFCVFDSGISGCRTSNMLSIFMDRWMPLLEWHDLLIPGDDYEIEQIFAQLSNGTINRDQFKALLEPTTNVIEKYAKGLEKKVTAKYHELEHLYDAFKGFDPKYEFILKNSAFRDNIFNLLLHYYN